WVIAARRWAAPDGVPHPVPAGPDVEGPREYPRAGPRHTDDHRLAPAAMAAFERLAHQLGVAHAFEAVIGAAIGQLDDVGDQVLAVELVRIDEVGEAELAPQCLARRIEIDADDHVGANHARALHDVEPDAAQPEHHHIGARLDLGGIDHRADASGDAAAYVADLVERRVSPDLGQRDLGQHRIVREG